MRKIETKPLTDFKKIPIQVTSKQNLDLRKSKLSAEQQDELIKKFLQEIGKMKDNGKIIIAQSNETDSYVMARITPSKRKQNILMFPEPNPVIIYYNTAINHVENAIKLQKEIISKEWSPNNLYLVFIEFFSEAFQSITQLIMSVEALFNQKIAEDLILEKDGKQLSKKDIEWQDFKEKYRYILPLITGIDIFKNHNTDYQNMLRINNLRNDLIHLKSIKQENFTFYHTVFKALIDLDFESHANSIHDIIKLLG